MILTRLRASLSSELARARLRAHKSAFQYILVALHAAYGALRGSEQVRVAVPGLRGGLRFISCSELMHDLDTWVPSLADDYDVIVGVPRSGLLAASAIALKLGKPLSVPDRFPEIVWQSEQMRPLSEISRVLLIDDSVSTGKALARAKASLARTAPEVRISTAAVYVTDEGRALVDAYHAVVPRPRLFEWNMLHAKRGTLGVDFDGVLSEDCPRGLVAGTEAYGAWLISARPYLIPHFEIDCIVSNRLEAYRADTEAWLARHGVRYKKLILAPEKNEEDKVAHKAGILARERLALFWESSRSEAEALWKRTGTPILCTDTRELFS